jgi:hypothetical protein
MTAPFAAARPIGCMCRRTSIAEQYWSVPADHLDTRSFVKRESIGMVLESEPGRGERNPDSGPVVDSFGASRTFMTQNAGEGDFENPRKSLNLSLS